MVETRRDDDRFLDLMTRHLEHQLEPGELMELDALLSADPSRSEEFLETHILVRNMTEYGATRFAAAPVSRGDSPGGSPSSLAGSLLTVGYWRAHPAYFCALSLTLTLLFWVGVGWIVLPHLGGGGPERPTDATHVAQIIDMRGAIWSEGANAFNEDDMLDQHDVLDLVSGFVRIKFADGAIVLLEGPAHFALDSRRAGTLERGQLVARIENQAEKSEVIPFSISTPSAQIIDLGTEFGVVTEEDGSTQIKVFQGRVEAAPRGGAGAARSHAIQLSQGESARIRAGSTQFENDPPARRFVQEMPEENSLVIRPVAVECLGGISYVPPERLIDGSGLQEAGPIESWTHDGEGRDDCCWQTAARDLPVTLLFDLGADYELQSVWIWNYSHADVAFLVRCTRRVRVEVSTDGESYTLVGELDLTQQAQEEARGKRFRLSEHARYVRFIVLECGDISEAGLGEVRFEGLLSPKVNEEE